MNNETVGPNIFVPIANEKSIAPDTLSSPLRTETTIMHGAKIAVTIKPTPSGIT